MRFCEQLNEYITRLDCRGKELAEAAGLSAPSLSRYRTGERTPGRGSAVLTALSDALADMAKAKALPDMDADTLYSAFLQCDEYAGTDKKMLRENFNALIEVMGLSVAKLCRCANYDPSAIFRFRRGERQPAEPEQFAAAVASYVSREMDGPAQREVASALLGCAAEDLGDRAAYCRRVQDWLLGSHAPREDSVSRFLTKLDEFDLNAYIRSVHFDELKVPVAPFQLPTSRSYSGLRQMMDSELDFMKAAVLSRSTEPVFMYSDMPMTEMAQDPEFPKKWMFGMALLLKKGLRLQIIHNIDRNLPEMMLGLESFIPMYMTGQIEPYYFKAPQGGVFLHFLRVSGTAALTGEAVSGHHSEGAVLPDQQPRRGGLLPPSGRRSAGERQAADGDIPCRRRFPAERVSVGRQPHPRPTAVCPIGAAAVYRGPRVFDGGAAKTRCACAGSGAHPGPRQKPPGAGRNHPAGQ